MSATTQQGVSSTAPKPVLHGVRIRTRKSVQKAQAKFEPVAFRDDLIKVLLEAKPGDLDDIAGKLDLAGNKLDYRRYVETLFEILLTGGVLAPGGTFIEDETAHSPFSFFTAEDNAESIRAHVEVLNKLIRRYKYLQRGFEDTIKNILQYINKFNAGEQSKLAMALGIFMSNGLVAVNVLTVLFKEHLVKDGLSLQFVTAVFRSYLTESKIDNLGSALKKAGMDTKLLDFFPINKRDSDCFARHFEAEDMKALVEYQNKKAKTHLKDNIVDELREMLGDEDSSKTIPEVVAHLKSQMKENNLPEAEFVCLVWDGIVASVEWSSRSETVENQALRTATTYGDLVNAFCTSPKSELALLQKIQLTCYVDAKLMKSFHIIMKNLYKQDVISGSAIIYWYEKGSKSNGKAVFAKQTETFVTWLKQQEEEDSEDEEEED